MCGPGSGPGPAAKWDSNGSGITGSREELREPTGSRSNSVQIKPDSLFFKPLPSNAFPHRSAHPSFCSLIGQVFFCISRSEVAWRREVACLDFVCVPLSATVCVCACVCAGLCLQTGRIRFGML